MFVQSEKDGFFFTKLVEIAFSLTFTQDGSSGCNNCHVRPTNPCWIIFILNYLTITTTEHI